MARLQNSYLVDNFTECDGCKNLFHNDEIVASVQLPYQACKDCEYDIVKQNGEE